EGDGMEVEDEGIMMCGVKQVEEGDCDTGPFVTQTQAGKPEGREGSTCYYQGLKDKECFGSVEDVVEEGDGNKDWFKMNGKAGDTLQTVAVRVTDDVTYALMEQVAVQGIPDGLVHYTEVFCVGQVGVLPACEIKDEIGGEE